MGGPPSGKMRNQMLQLKEDIGRIKRALIRIDNEIMHWNREWLFEDMEVMVRRNISERLLYLCKLPGITKGRADYLYNAGVRIVEDLVDVYPNIEEELDDSFRGALQEIINGLSRQSGGKM